MQKPSFPENEIGRLKDLYSLEILDSKPDEILDSMTNLAQRVFHVKTVLISLVDADRQWFKSRQGLDALETPRDISFCGHVILQNELFEIPNALEDARFADNPLVTGGPKIRFYAGIPIKTANGFNIGTICLIDDKPKKLTDEEKLLFHQIQQMIQAYIISSQQKIAHEITMSVIKDAIIVHDRVGKIVYLNPPTEALLGDSLTPLFGQETWSLGKNISQSSSPDESSLNEIMHALHHKPLPHHGQTVLFNGADQEFQVQYRIEPLMRGGFLTNTVIVLKDLG